MPIFGVPIPKVGAALLATFAGPQAQTADHGLHDLAQSMERQGYGRDEIWQQTGWGRSGNGTWMFEVDDSAARLKDWNGRGPTTLGQLLHHPELFAAYPEYRQMPVQPLPPGVVRQGITGTYNALSNTMGIDPTWMDSETLSDVLHEGNHAAAAREGRERGTSSRATGSFGAYWNDAGERESRNVETRREMSPAERRRIPPWQTE